MSVNIIDAVWNVVGAGGGGVNVTAAAAAAACGARGLTAVRFAATPYWPDDLRAWRDDPVVYWAAVDGAMAALAASCNYLVPSLFFNVFAVPDLTGAPLGSLAFGARGGASPAWAAMTAYAAQFVARYAQLPIGAWELFNELNLLFDLDASTMCTACAPARGTPAARTRADNVSTDDGVAVLAALAAVVRAADPSARPVSSGHSLPRPCAEHLRASYYAPERDWGNDTVPQFFGNLADVNAAVDLASVHVYPGADNARWGETTADAPTILLWAQAAVANASAARVAGGRAPLALYLGEFGALPAPGASPAAPRPFVDATLALLRATGAASGNPPWPGVAGSTALATIWVWEFGGQNSTWALWPGATDGVIESIVAYNQN